MVYNSQNGTSAHYKCSEEKIIFNAKALSATRQAFGKIK
tara:strand:+ start:3227 stop:3343 length:117 start_codon:yes stop_codon:yes gene_type:complete